jgi:hypothetical protein
MLQKANSLNAMAPNERELVDTIAIGTLVPFEEDDR